MYLQTGYGEELYDNKKLRKVVDELTQALPGIMSMTRADTVAVTGKSGIGMGFAALMRMDFPIMLVRKENESSHGGRIEGTGEHNVRRYLLLDDFISSGNTLDRVVNTVAEYSKRYGEAEPECVGVVQYAREGSNPWSKTVQAVERYRQMIPVFSTLNWDGMPSVHKGQDYTHSRIEAVRKVEGGTSNKATWPTISPYQMEGLQDLLAKQFEIAKVPPGQNVNQFDYLTS